MKLWFLVAFFSLNNVYADVLSGPRLGHLWHQFEQKNPCWEVTQAEMAPLLKQAKQCGLGIKGGERIQHWPKVYYRVTQEIIFDLAAHEFNKTSQCLKGMFQLLQAKEVENEIYDYWVNATSTNLAIMVHRRGRVARLNRFVEAKNRELYQMGQSGKSTAEIKAVQENPTTQYAAEVQSDLSLQETSRNSIPFIEHPTIYRFVTKIADDLYTTAPETFPKDVEKISQELEAKIRSGSGRLFAQLIKDFNQDFAIDSYDEKDRKHLLEQGYVTKALAQVINAGEPLHKKLQNCVEGEYGKRQNQVEMTGEVGWALASGFAGVAKRSLGGIFSKAALWGLMKDKNLAAKIWNGMKRFGLAGLTGHALKVLPEQAIAACFKDTDSVAPEQPLNCENTGELKSYALKWFKAQSCLANSLKVAIIPAFGAVK